MNLNKFLLNCCFVLLVISCGKQEGETIETAYIDPRTLPQVFTYSFSRNGVSSVDVLECTNVKSPIDMIFSRLYRASFYSEDDYNDVVNYYTQGSYNIKPAEQVANSLLHKSDFDKIDADIRKTIAVSAKIGGYQVGKPFNTSNFKNIQAEKGALGYIGYSVGDPNRQFVDEKGIVISDFFQSIILGGIYLDKVLNYHLDESFLDDKTLRKNHEDVVLVAGQNYTALEHHWDLAYGYYSFLANLTQLHGISILKDSQRILFEAFVQGRIELSRYRYDAMKIHLKIIRSELSRVLAIAAMHYLTSANTISNLEENPTDAFLFITKGYGLIYALQFTRKEDGELYFSYDDVQKMMESLTQGDGLWQVNRLLSDENTEGSLRFVANAIGKPFNLTINHLQR